VCVCVWACVHARTRVCVCMRVRVRAVSVVTDSRPDDWCFVPERQDLSFTFIFRLALDMGKILCKRKEKIGLICVRVRACQIL